jgi:hypothetical protein
MTFKNLLTIVFGGMLILLLGVGLGMHLYAQSIREETEQMARTQETSCDGTGDEPHCATTTQRMTDQALPVLMRCLPGGDMLSPN